jgi:hypothetical protein
MVSALRVLARTRSLYGAADQLDSCCSYRRRDRASNCDFVAWGSLIDLATSRLALRAPALRAAAALTRPNRPAQRLPCARHAVPTTKTVGPSIVVANHRIECRDHLPHHRNDHDLRQFAGGFQTIVKDFERRIPITGTHHDPAPVTAHNALFSPYKTARVHHTARRGGGRVATGGTRVLARKAAHHRLL